MKVVISNFSRPLPASMDYKSYWNNFNKPPKKERISLFENKIDWGFHIYSLGVYLLDKGIADEVEFWDYTNERSAIYHSYGILRVMFHNDEDVKAYINKFGYPDLYIQHGRYDGLKILPYLENKCFRVYVPALRGGIDLEGNFNAECYLVDSEEFLDDRSMMYIPVVNTKKIYPNGTLKKRDFIYLAAFYDVKRHDIIINALKGKELTGHFHPVDGRKLDLRDTHITTTDFNEAYVPELLQTSKIAVYPGDNTSSPASMWECVAAGLPIVVNEKICGGKHLVIPGVTGEFASEENYYDVMKYVLTNLDSYKPREYFMEHWDTITTIEKYLSFFIRMGWKPEKSIQLSTEFNLS